MWVLCFRLISLYQFNPKETFTEAWSQEARHSSREELQLWMSSSLSEENMSWGIARLLHPELSLPICFWFDLPRKQSLWPPGSSESLHNDRVLISEDVLDLLPICQKQLETVSLASKLRPWCLHVLSRKMKWRKWIIFFMQNLTFAYRSKKRCRPYGERLTKPRPL